LKNSDSSVSRGTNPNSDFDWARGGADPRATRSSIPQTPVSLCFQVQRFEATEIPAACRACASAQKTPQNTEKNSNFRKIVWSANFSEIRVFCGVFCALANARQAANVSGISSLMFRVSPASGPETEEKGVSQTLGPGNRGKRNLNLQYNR